LYDYGGEYKGKHTPDTPKHFDSLFLSDVTKKQPFVNDKKQAKIISFLGFFTWLGRQKSAILTWQETKDLLVCQTKTIQMKLMK
jgi:hypothetical protein